MLYQDEKMSALSWFHVMNLCVSSLPLLDLSLRCVLGIF